MTDNIIEELKKAGKEVVVDTFSGNKFGDLVTNSKICKDFKVENVKGIRINKEGNYCVIISDTAFKNENNIYPDIFDFKDELDKFTLYYVGEGKKGDQNIELPRNSFLRNSINKKSNIYVFQFIDKNEYQYLGEFFLESISKAMQPDENEELREVIIFKLNPKFI